MKHSPAGRHSQGSPASQSAAGEPLIPRWPGSQLPADSRRADQVIGQRSRSGRYWPLALPGVAARHVTRAMPWGTLLAGCLTSIALLALLAYVADAGHWALGQGNVRITFLPVVGAFAFVPRDPFRAVAEAAPCPAWLTSAGQILLAVPVLAATCWVQLRLMAHTASHLPPGFAVHSSAVYPLLAVLTGWCSLAVVAAACCDRSRYADLGGAVAAPVTLAVIALAWYWPRISRFLVTPPATAHAATTAWYVIAAVALALSCVAMTDRWRRYTRRIRRPRISTREH